MSHRVDDQITIRDIAMSVVRHRALAAIVFVVIAAAATTRTLLTPKSYEAHMKVLVKNERADTVVSAGNSSLRYVPEVDESQVNSEIELLNSNSLLRGVVVKCGLDRDEGAEEDAPKAIERATIRLQKALKVTPVRKSSIIQVDYTNTSPQLAASVLEQLGTSYLDEHLKAHATPGTFDFFTKEAARYRAALLEAEGKLAEFRKRENIVGLTEQQNTMIQKQAEAEAALKQTEANIRDYTARTADIRAKLASSEARVRTQSRTIPNQYSVERLHTMLAELVNRRTQLLAKYKADDRLVLEVNQEIADTQTALEKATKLVSVEEATDVNPVHQALEIDLAKQHTELVGLQERRFALARQSVEYQRDLMRLGRANATHEDLARAQKEAEESYLLYAKKAEEARITDSLDKQKISNVSIAETPVVPALPSKPNVPMNIAFGLAFAAFVSVGSALATEHFGAADKTERAIYNAETLGDATDLPVLGTAYRN
jgi:uncharacterized protein involved in exopolysaccharide biosynthesis